MITVLVSSMHFVGISAGSQPDDIEWRGTRYVAIELARRVGEVKLVDWRKQNRRIRLRSFEDQELTSPTLKRRV